MSLADRAPAALARPAAPYRARITAFCAQDWLPRGQITLFQRAEWLAPFHAALAREPAITPFTAEVTDAQGTLAFRLPLILQRRNGIRVVEFADLGMTDFNAPLPGPAAPATPRQTKQAWNALRAALPPHDLLHLTKMPPNPLLPAPAPMACAVNGNLLTMGEDWNGFHFGLEKTVRKELERSWRVFCREPGTRLEIINDPTAALALLDAMEPVQRARMAELGQPYGLDAPLTAAFYRKLLQSGIGNGFAFLTALKAGDELVAALLGVRDGETYIMIRLVHAGGAWSKVSPGRLLIHKTLEHLHAQGYRRFDFSVGNYAYKRRFGPTRTPLYDLAAANTLAGMPALLRIRAGALLRRYPQARETVRRILGKPPTREEN